MLKKQLIIEYSYLCQRFLSYLAQFLRFLGSISHSVILANIIITRAVTYACF